MAYDPNPLHTAVPCPVLAFRMHYLPAHCYAMAGALLCASYLCISYAMSGTDVAYGPVSLRASDVLSGSDRRSSRPRYWHSVWCNTMSGTGTAYGAVCLRSRYAMSGTDMAYGAASTLERTAEIWVAMAGCAFRIALCA
eukprot:2950608-Rhodomonas_salina.1